MVTISSSNNSGLLHLFAEERITITLDGKRIAKEVKNMSEC